MYVLCAQTKRHREMYVCIPVVTSNPYHRYKLNFHGHCRWSCLPMKRFSELVMACGSVKDIPSDWGWKGDWENEAPRQSSFRRVTLVNTRELHKNPGDLYSEPVWHWTICNIPVLQLISVKQREYFTAYWENELISACEMFANKRWDKHH